jgi:hypothetical protein
MTPSFFRLNAYAFAPDADGNCKTADLRAANGWRRPRRKIRRAAANSVPPA